MGSSRPRLVPHLVHEPTFSDWATICITDPRPIGAS